VSTETIRIVDLGRGAQLSSCRITVQDVVPYLQMHYSREQIREIMPVLTNEELGVIEDYVRENHEAVMEADRRIRECAAARRKPPEVEASERQLRRTRLEEARQNIRLHKHSAAPAASTCPDPYTAGRVTLVQGGPAMKIGARNKLDGEVVNIKRGTVMCQVLVKVAGGAHVESVMTLDSVDEMKLNVGDKVRVAVKAVNVLLLKE
jgi:molybdopterin-binding protein